jgi:hypothetical protein
MYPQRLPIVNSDDGTWGNILLQYLQLQHVNTGTDSAGNGGHQNVTITAGTSSAAPLTLNSGTLLSTPATGSVEFNTDSLYFTISTGSVRKTVAMYDDSSGATGDTYYRTSSGAFSRLPIGSPGQILTVSSGLPAWSSGSTSNSNDYAIASKSSNYTIANSDAVILASASSSSVTITLPAASSCSGYQFSVKRIDNTYANTCTINTTGGDTIDGQSSILLNVQYVSLNMISNGSGWYLT